MKIKRDYMGRGRMTLFDENDTPISKKMQTRQETRIPKTCHSCSDVWFSQII